MRYGKDQTEGVHSSEPANNDIQSCNSSSDVVSPGYGRLFVNAFACLIRRERAVGVIRVVGEGSAVCNSLHIVPASQDNGEYAPKPVQTSYECIQDA